MKTIPENGSPWWLVHEPGEADESDAISTPPVASDKLSIWRREWPELARHPKVLKLMAEDPKLRRLVFRTLGTLRVLSDLNLDHRLAVLEPYMREQLQVLETRLESMGLPEGSGQVSSVVQRAATVIRQQVQEARKANSRKSRRIQFGPEGLATLEEIANSA